MKSQPQSVSPLQNKRIFFGTYLPDLAAAFLSGLFSILASRSIYSDILKIENEDLSFQVFKFVLGLIFVSFFILGKQIKKEWVKFEGPVMAVLLTLESAVLLAVSSKEIQVDYIFQPLLFQFFSGLNAAAAGYYISGLKKLRLWLYLAGIVSSYILFYSTFPAPSFTLLMGALVSQILGFILESLSSMKFHIRPLFFQNTRNNRTVTDVFFYSALLLFISHLGLYYYRGENQPDSLISGGGSALVIFNLIYHFSIAQKYPRYIFNIARIIIFINLIVTVRQASLNSSYSILFFLDLACLSILRPAHYDRKNIVLSAAGGLFLFYVFYLLHLNYTRTEYLYAFMLVAVILVWNSLILKTNLAIPHKLAVIFLCYGVCLKIFSPLPVQFYEDINSAQHFKTPYPFRLMNIDLDKERFVYFGTNLPFPNEQKLPKKTVFKDRILVLGAENNYSVILAYAENLNRDRQPYMLFQNSAEEPLSKSYLKTAEFPLFRVYYPEHMPKEFIPSPRTSAETAEEETVLKKILSLKSNAEILKTAEEYIKYYRGNAAVFAKKQTGYFYESYFAYASYFYSIQEFGTALDYILSAMEFGTDQALLDLAYKSVRTVPIEERFIPVIEKLLETNAYKEELLKKYIPYLSASGRTGAAVEKMSALAAFYSSGENRNPEKREETVAEKARLLLTYQKYYEAEELIKQEQKNSVNPLIWKKLQSELEFIKNTMAKPYYYPEEKSDSDKKSETEKKEKPKEKEQ
ncbi:MAG TPA: hypothetical protein PKV80_16255 [Leptospiraceae bacterium]|nr:hypothetical protein [Leptospiraceae bacterium]